MGWSKNAWSNGIQRGATGDGGTFDTRGKSTDTETEDRCLSNLNRKRRGKMRHRCSTLVWSGGGNYSRGKLDRT